MAGPAMSICPTQLPCRENTPVPPEVRVMLEKLPLRTTLAGVVNVRAPGATAPVTICTLHPLANVRATGISPLDEKSPPGLLIMVTRELAGMEMVLDPLVSPQEVLDQIQVTAELGVMVWLLVRISQLSS